MTGPGKARGGDHRPVSRSAGAIAEHDHRLARGHALAPPEDLSLGGQTLSAVWRFMPGGGSTAAGKSVRP